MRFAVIENEFGEIGVDQRILNERVNDEIIEGASLGPWDILDNDPLGPGHLSGSAWKCRNSPHHRTLISPIDGWQ